MIRDFELIVGVGDGGPLVDGPKGLRTPHT